MALLPVGACAFRLLPLLLLLAAVCAAPGCQNPPPAEQAPAPGLGDPWPAPMGDPQITVLSEDLRQWLAFHPAVVTKGEGQVMRVEVPVRNMGNRLYLIDYRILFYDADGAEQEPVMGWTPVALQPKETLRLKANSFDDTAENYRIEIKWGK